MKTKSEIILELVKSLNQGDVLFYEDRVRIAITQYDQMVKLGLIKE